MGTAVAVRTDYSSKELRGLASRVKNAGQARRLLSIAAVLDGSSREDAAKVGCMDRQTLRDWVLRFNEQGPEGLINKCAPGAPGKLSKKHKAFLARLVEEGPIPAIHGVVRWRACDLIMRLHEEFGISVSDDTAYRALNKLGFAHVSARPKAYRQDADAVETFEKNFPARVAEVRAKLTPGTPIEVWCQDEMRVGQKNKLTYRWARKGSRPRATHDQRTESTYLFGAVCPERGTGAALVLPACNSEAMQLHDFRYVAEENVYICPAGERLANHYKVEEHGLVLHRYWTSACRYCAIKSKCTTGKDRKISRWEHEHVVEAVQRRLDEHPEKMRQRRETVEHPFGTIKVRMGATHFLMKTLPRVASEMALHVLGYNLTRVMNIMGIGPLMAAMRA